MNDEDGYTMVDETFGVREASDVSDTDIDSPLPPPSDRINTTTVVEHSSTRVSPLPQHDCSSSSSSSSSIYNKDDPNTLIGIHEERQEEAAICNSLVAGEEGVAPALSMLNNDSNIEKSSIQRDDHFTTEEGSPERASRRARDVACGVRIVPASPMLYSSDNNGGVGCSPRPAAITSPAGVTMLPIISEQESPAMHNSIKTVNVTLLPGDGGCSFGMVVQGRGKGSLASLDDLERGVQRCLGLRQRVRLGDVQVEGAGARAVDDIANAPDGSTITVRPVDQVLVRARVCTMTSADTIRTPVSPYTTSPADRYVSLSLSSTWPEVVESVRDSLGVWVPAGYRMELTRESHLDDQTPLSRVCDLCNGDPVVLVLLEDRPGQGGPDGDAIFVGVHGRNGNSGVKDELSEAEKNQAAPVVLESQFPPQLALEPPSSSPAREEARVREISLDKLVAAPARVPTPFDSSQGFLPPHAAITPVRGQAYHPVSNVGLPDDRRESCAGAFISWGSPLGNSFPASYPAAASSSSLQAPSRSSHVPGSLQHDLLVAASLRSGNSDPTPVSALLALSSPDLTLAGVAPTPPPADGADEAAIAELVGMGFDRGHVIGALRVCGRGESWKEAAISLLLEPQMSAAEVAAVEDLEAGLKRHKPGGQVLTPAGPSRCPICLSDVLPEEAFTVNCDEQHVFCLDCLYEHCSVQLLDSGLIPACPLSNMMCGHELSQEEVERVCLLRSSFSVFAVGKSVSGEEADVAGMAVERNKRVLDTCRTLITRRGLKATGAIPCVSPECGNWMVPERAGHRVRCDSCLTEFCLKCKRAPYHYAVECGNVVRLAREWAHWLTEGKGAFLRVTATQNSRHQALLSVYQRKKREHDRAVEEAERVRNDYDNMENWKEQRCKLCPSCGRTIEKISGCDTMRCGMDAHGGNVQNGCGACFVWPAALPYVGDRGARKEMPFTEAEPQAAAHARHFIAPGIPLRCDRCHRDVVGPLFRCIHCPSFACCLECQDAACRDPRHVHHTFQIIGNGDTNNNKEPESLAAGSGGRDFGDFERGGARAAAAGADDAAGVRHGC